MNNVRVRKILHMDLDAFFCAVEELKNPSLAGKAFAVGARAEDRGVISTCSYPARKLGIHSALPTAQAMRLCPRLILIAGSHHEYSRKSEEVMEVVNQLSGMVEQISVDEAFIDVTDLPQDLEEIARKLQADIYSNTSLPCSIGGSTNKLVAKIATDAGKVRSKGDSYPRAILIVPPGKEMEFLAPLPVKAMWGIGPKTEQVLFNAGLRTIGDISSKSKKELEKLLGKYGLELYDRARGIDDRPVFQEHEAKSVNQETTYSKDTADLTILRQTLKDLSAHVGYRLRQDGYCARVIRLKIRWGDFTTHTRQLSLSQPTDQDGVIYDKVETLFKGIWDSEKPVRLIGVAGANLVESSHQMTLWETQTERERKLLDALDQISEKYGKQTVKRAFKIKPEKK